MRQYRGKTKDGEWAKGWYFELRGESFIIPTTGPLAGNFETPASFACNFVEVIPESVGQDTGLKDKNGKAIFGSLEGTKGGDIIRYMDGKSMEVFYSTKGYIGWNLKRKANHGTGMLIYGLYNHSKTPMAHEEVIGRAYEEKK